MAESGGMTETGGMTKGAGIAETGGMAKGGGSLTSQFRSYAGNQQPWKWDKSVLTWLEVRDKSHTKEATVLILT